MLQNNLTNAIIEVDFGKKRETFTTPRTIKINFYVRIFTSVFEFYQK